MRTEGRFLQSSLRGFNTYHIRRANDDNNFSVHPHRAPIKTLQSRQAWSCQRE